MAQNTKPNCTCAAPIKIGFSHQCCMFYNNSKRKPNILNSQEEKYNLRWYLTLQGDNSLTSVESFDHMMFVCRFQASRYQNHRENNNRNYSAILATLQITSYALGVYIELLFTCQLHESLIKLYFNFFFYISIIFMDKS